MTIATARKGRSNPRGVARIDQDSTRTHGWYARVGFYRDRKGVWKTRHSKFFGDVGHGGKKKALKMAEAYVAKCRREDERAGLITTKKVATRKKAATKKKVAAKKKPAAKKKVAAKRKPAAKKRPAARKKR